MLVGLWNRCNLLVINYLWFNMEAFWLGRSGGLCGVLARGGMRDAMGREREEVSVGMAEWSVI